MVISRYERWRHERAVQSVAFVIVSAGFLFAGILPLVQLPGVQGVPLAVPLIAFWAVLAYAFLFRRPFSMELTATELRWRTMFHVKSCPLGQVEAIRIRQSADGYKDAFVAEIRLSGRRRPLIILIRRSWTNFAADIKVVAPHVKMRAPDNWPPPPRYRRSGRPPGEQ